MILEFGSRSELTKLIGFFGSIKVKDPWKDLVPKMETEGAVWAAVGVVVGLRVRCHCVNVWSHAVADLAVQRGKTSRE